MTEPRSRTSAAGAATEPDEPYEKRWLALGIIAMTVLLVILDATIVDIALPAVTTDLGRQGRPARGRRGRPRRLIKDRVPGRHLWSARAFKRAL